MSINVELLQDAHMDRRRALMDYSLEFGFVDSQQASEVNEHRRPEDIEWDAIKYDRFISFIAQNSDGLVVDLGTGQGNFVMDMREMGFENIYGTEYDPRLADGEYVLQIDADEKSLPFDDGEVSLALACNSVFHYALDEEDFVHNVREIERVLCEDGVLLATVVGEEAVPLPMREMGDEIIIGDFLYTPEQLIEAGAFKLERPERNGDIGIFNLIDLVEANTSMVCVGYRAYSNKDTFTFNIGLQFEKRAI